MYSKHYKEREKTWIFCTTYPKGDSKNCTHKKIQKKKVTKKYSTQVCATMKVVCEILTHVWRERVRGGEHFSTLSLPLRICEVLTKIMRKLLSFSRSPPDDDDDDWPSCFTFGKSWFCQPKPRLVFVCVCGKLSLISSRSHFGPASWSFVGKDKHHQVQLAWAKTEKT